MAMRSLQSVMRSMSRRTAVGAAASVVLTLGVVPVVASPAAAEDRRVRIVGSLQSELGCAADWDPACDATEIELVDGSTYSGVFTLPAGAYSYKVAVNGSWDENYGAGGAAGGADIPVALAGPAQLRFSYDDETHLMWVQPVDLSGPVTSQDRSLAADSLRAGLTKERFYFLMADRFANGSTANDLGGLTGDRMATGFDPSDKGFFHGGDLAGLTQRLDYIKDLGTTAIWLTPSFKNRPVQGSEPNASAGYHGYWVTDFTQIDPHFGTNEEMKSLIAAAHDKGMKVFFDIITNHTADVIRYESGEFTYVSKEASPYLTAAGQPFDDKEFAGPGSTFPDVDPATSFPYVPVFANPEDASVKVPAWLNDPTMYHNRGDSTFAGESSEYGDFVGLDDLWTERPEVVEGMSEIYKAWVDLGIDGFRIDTVKHVNLEFWQQFSPDVLDHARAQGKSSFFMFGEVFDGNPSYLSTFSTAGKLQATLDFGFQGSALGFAQGKPTTGLRDLFAQDDYYTDADSNAYSSPTFLGNHDMGRAAMMLKNAGFTGSDLLARTKLAHSLMYVTRGQPVVYYGDEQGFIGSGGDKDSRQDMFATEVEQYAGEQILGGGTLGSRDRYSKTVPLYQHIAGLAALRKAHPALADGAQVPRYSSSGDGIFAISRIDKARDVEYLVVANNSTSWTSASLSTFSPGTTFANIYGPGGAIRTDALGRVTAGLPGLSVSVFRATKPMPAPAARPSLSMLTPTPGATVGGRAQISAAAPDRSFTQVTFLQRPVGTADWQLLGTDDNAPFRVFHDVTGLAKGTLVEYRAVAKGSSGRINATASWGVVGEPAAPGGGGGDGGPVVQPANVSVPGTHNSEMGCPADWVPDCDQAQLELDTQDLIWKKTFTGLPAGPAQYKAAINKSWDENYGAGAVLNGGNIEYTVGTEPVTFYYDHGTHWVTSDAQSPILTAPGDYQSELGCSADWLADCMRPWLQDPDGDNVWSWVTTQLPAGTYQFKVAHELSWDVNYGAGGVLDGSNVVLSVPADGMRVTISYDLGTHAISTSVVRPGSTPDLTTSRAAQVTGSLIAWPAADIPAGADPANLSWRVHWTRPGSLRLDTEAIVGGHVSDLVPATAWPAALLAAEPELANYLPLRVPSSVVPRLRGLTTDGEIAVGMYDVTGLLVDATGVADWPLPDGAAARSR